MKRIRILHLEDSAADSILISAHLKEAGLSFEILRIYTEATFTAALRDPEIDLILADYSIPGYDGLVALQTAHLARPDVPYIVVSGVVGETRAVEVIKAGADDFVLKDQLDRLGPAVQRALRDGSERRRAEATLRNVTQHARCILWHSTVVGLPGLQDPKTPGWPRSALKWDSHVYDETAAQQYLPLNVAPGEPYFRAWANARLPEDARRMDETSVSAMLRGDHSYSQEFRCIDRTGRVRWLFEDVVIEPAGTSQWRLFGVVTDITERKEAEQERARLLALEQKARADAEAANQRKDQFLAVLSHELRTPLTPILAAVGLLKGGRSVPPESDQLVELIGRNAELEARLIDDLLDLARASSGKLQLSFEVVDLHGLIRGAVQTFSRDAAAKGVRLVVDLSAPSYHVKADAVRLQQVLWNLVGNAVKFTPSHGMVTLRTRRGPGDGVTMEVQDTGVGIEPEALCRIFHAFEQGEQSLTRRFGGLGLGLTISRTLVEAHGGTITATSGGRDAGATFTVNLATVPTPRPASVPLQPRIPPRRQGAKLLLVEDNEDTLRALSRVLKTLGHEVRTAVSVRSAVEAAGTGEFDLLISDIGLPDGTGWELMKSISATRPMTAIALSGFGSDDDIERSREAGFCEHLVKPVSLQKLEGAIDRALRVANGA